MSSKKSEAWTEYWFKLDQISEGLNMLIYYFLGGDRGKNILYILSLRTLYSMKGTERDKQLLKHTKILALNKSTAFILQTLRIS